MTAAPSGPTPRSASGAFSSRDYVVRYEAWYETPFGRLADELEREMIDALLAPLPAAARVLEVGCGTAHFGSALARSGADVVGCDPSFAMLRAASERVPPLRGVVLADGRRLPFADGSFDAVLLVAVLEFVDDAQALLRELCRVARRRVVVVTVSRWSYLALRRTLSGWHGNRVFADARYRSTRSLTHLARSVGAEVVAVRSALRFPPALATLVGPLERRLARSRVPGAGVVGLALDVGHHSPPSGESVSPT